MRADTSGNPVTVSKTRANSSPVFALTDTLVIRLLLLRFGAAAWCAFASTGAVPEPADRVVDCLVAGLTLFAPYAAKQFSGPARACRPSEGRDQANDTNLVKRRHQMNKQNTAAIRVGIGGWTFEPWRNNFYPPGLSASRELHYASRQLTAIEINGTYYSTQKPAVFAKWRDETPEGFVFSVKASRFTTNRRVLADAGESIDKFIGSGLAELGGKLGPLLWQFMPTKQFDPVDFGAFLKLLPGKLDGRDLRHVLDVRHQSFVSGEFLALARRYKMATVFADSDDYPSFSDPTADFIYARLMRTQSPIPTGYTPEALDAWANRAKLWAGGKEPDDLPRVSTQSAPKEKRDVFLFMISGAKERAPAAAQALIGRL